MFKGKPLKKIRKCKSCHSKQSVESLNYCLDCLCSISACRNSKYDIKEDEGVCKSHSVVCDFDSCNKITSSNNKPYCSKHSCPSPGCVKVNPKYQTKDFSNKKCGCWEKIYVSYDSYKYYKTHDKICDQCQICFSHKCHIDFCYKLKLSDKGVVYCQDHLCVYPDCNQPVINSSSSVKFLRGKYCKGHICNKCGSLNENFPNIDICSKCKCQTKSCKSCKIRGNYCNYHVCGYPKCLKESITEFRTCKDHICRQHNKVVTGDDKLCETCVENLRKNHQKIVCA